MREEVREICSTFLLPQERYVFFKIEKTYPGVEKDRPWIIFLRKDNGLYIVGSPETQEVNLNHLTDEGSPFYFLLGYDALAETTMGFVPFGEDIIDLESLIIEDEDSLLTFIKDSRWDKVYYDNYKYLYAFDCSSMISEFRYFNKEKVDLSFRTRNRLDFLLEGLNGDPLRIYLENHTIEDLEEAQVMIDEILEKSK